jgi:hypothetical protein
MSGNEGIALTMKETLVRAVGIVFSERGYRVLGGVSFAFFLLVYLLVLPASYTGARIGLISLAYLTPRLAAFALAFAALLGLVVPMTLFVMREGRKARKATTAGSLAVSLLTPLLCCSPLLPAVMSVAAAALPFVTTSAGLRVQRFIVTYETELYLGAALLLALALYQNARAVVSCPRCRS